MHFPVTSIISAGGDDKWLSIYSIPPANPRLLTRLRTPSPIRCIDFEAKNVFLAVGMAAGVIGVYFLHKQRLQGQGQSQPFVRRRDCGDIDVEDNVFSLHELCTRKDCLQDISGSFSIFLLL